MKIALGVIVAMLIWSDSDSSTLPRLSVEELFKEADEVVLVQVVNGQVLGELEESCGAKYKARVTRKFKGVSSEYIHFGHFYGYEIGSKYLLFLTKPDRDFHPSVSTNSQSMKIEREFLKKCSRALKHNKIMHSGYGALKIMWTGKYEYKNAVAVPSKYVAFPESVTRKPADLGERGKFSDYVWILESDVIEYLEKLTESVHSKASMEAQ